MHINFEEDKKEVLDMSTDNDKKSLSDQVEKLKDLEDSIVAKEEELKQLKQQADAISGEVIPTMMQELNISTLKLADGSAVEVKPVYGASISAERKEEAFEWLRSNGLGDLIKNEVTVSFGRNEEHETGNRNNRKRK
jgi:hypothetical protein